MNGAVPAELTRVLIVEDEDRLRTVLMEGVRDIGFPAVGVRCAEDAVRAMEQAPSDIAILDLNLPRMDGLKCFELLRERWPDLQVIILTGFGTLEAAQTAIKLGVVEFLTKPASLGDIEQALHRAWRRRPAPAPVAEAVSSEEPDDGDADPGEPGHPPTLRDIERESIYAALERHHGNREKAAEELGISVRKLYYRLAEYEHPGGGG